MEKPTELAEHYFRNAQNTIMVGFDIKSVEDPFSKELALCLARMCDGLSSRSVGLRATYLLLSEVDRKLDKMTADSLTRR